MPEFFHKLCNRTSDQFAKALSSQNHINSQVVESDDRGNRDEQLINTRSELFLFDT